MGIKKDRGITTKPGLKYLRSFLEEIDSKI